MDPDANRFKPLTPAAGDAPDGAADLVRQQEAIRKQLLQGSADLSDPTVLVLPDGKPVPRHWAVFQVGEDVVIKGYTFRVAYIGETAILFEPVGLPVVGEGKD